MSDNLHVVELISRLMDHGMTETAIAKSTGAAQSTINRVHKGLVDCRYSLYLKIKNLYQQSLLVNVKEAAQ